MNKLQLGQYLELSGLVLESYYVRISIIAGDDSVGLFAHFRVLFAPLVVTQ
tara:strand:- start:784 stop:936 length:153 start_codon:yes stop_codon:yes gene_type:complete